jgi:serine/threonine protein kinase
MRPTEEKGAKMVTNEERRIWPREKLATPEVAILYPQSGRDWLDPSGAKESGTLFAYVLNRSEGGFLLETSFSLEKGDLLDIRVKFPDARGWLAYHGTIAWMDRKHNVDHSYLVGVEVGQPSIGERLPADKTAEAAKRMCPAEVEFLMQTPLFNAIPQEAKCPFLDKVKPLHLRAGERFISQGDEGDNFYIIQEGSCTVSVEKEGTSHPIARLKTGDIVGEMALLTGERRTAHVAAETNLSLWSLSRTDFDGLCMNHPDLRDFLTELITHRFATERLTADRTLGKYVINEVVGRGGWSIVYRGTHTSLNMPVAIKMLKHTMAMNPDFSESFKNEAKTIANLNHENIVKVYDIEETYRTIFIIMEYLEGISLESALKRMPKLPVSRILDIILQICAGLSYAHEQGIIHQDIKPANIFIQPDDRAKIVDFGLACSPGTIDFCLPGTAYYMSPEQIQGESVDERTDIYSLGIMAYEMATGERPYPEDDLAKLMDLHMHVDIPDPRLLVPDLPKALHHFIKRATQRDPAARFRSIWEILRDLQPFADQVGVRREPEIGEQRKMMSLFLFYQDEHQLILNKLVEDFSSELKKIGAVLRGADFKDV